MLKQRHSSSGLSSKTLSRSKFINRTIQQTHNVSTQSGKQGRTLRYPSKNKSCLIPRHLAQSTQSHIICSNQSNRYKTNNRNNDASQKIQNNNEQNTNPNITQNNQSQMQYNKGRLIESKLTQPQNSHYRSSTLVKGQQKFTYKPFLSVPAGQQSHFKGNILSRLSDLTQNISSSDLVQKVPSQMMQRVKNHIQVSQNSTNLMMRDKVLQRQVKQSFLYKNIQLSKALQEMHRFYICVNELKWVCEQVHLVIKKYNEQIITFYQQYSAQNMKRNDLQNILTESGQLLKRFNQLQMINHTQSGQLFNFNLLANNTFSTSLIDQKEEKSFVNNNHNNRNHTQTNYNNQSPQNQHSWSKLIQNIQQNPLNKNNNIKNQNVSYNNVNTNPNNDENKNISIRTFQLTQTNSPFKNKTLNQLIRLSQLRKTEFISNYGSSNKQNNPNSTNQKLSDKQQYNQNYNRFTKKPKSTQIGLRLISPQKDPFDSIHLPHFNIKPPQNITINQQPYMAHQEKLFYEEQILRLNKQIEAANQQNTEIHRKLDIKFQQLTRQNNSLKQQLKTQKQNFNEFEKTIYRLVQTALNELINCAKISNQTVDNRKGSHSMNNLSEIGRSQAFYKQQPMILIGNKSFFQMVHCLQQVFKINKQNNKINVYTQQSKLNNNKRQSQMIQKSNYQLKNADFNKITKQKQSLMQQIQQLSILKQQLEQEIIKKQKNLNKVQHINSNFSLSQSYNQMTQMIFAQAFTIEDMLQLDQQDN